MGLIAVMLFSKVIFAADFRGKTNLLINRLSSVLPYQWRLEKVDNPEKAWWMFYKKGEFIEIRLVGPMMSGHRYIYQSGETKDMLFRNEAIYLWITPSSFYDGWNLWRRFRYRFDRNIHKIAGCYSDIFWSKNICTTRLGRRKTPFRIIWRPG